MASVRPPPLADIAPGILVTLVGWIVLGAAFGRYLAQFSSAYVTTYSGLASAMIALVFLYWTARNLRLWRRIQPGDPPGAGEAEGFIGEQWRSILPRVALLRHEERSASATAVGLRPITTR